MAFSPIAFIAPNFRDFPTYWVKPYIPGTTTPKPLALESDGGTQVAKLEINTDGFLKSAGGALVIPYIDGAYDIWMFPTKAEADDDDTTNALRIADDITGFNDAANEVLIKAIQKYTLAEAVALTSAIDGQIVQITDRADGQFTYLTGQVANTLDIVQCVGVPTLALVLRENNLPVNPITYGALLNGTFDDTPAVRRIIEDLGLVIDQPKDSTMFLEKTTLIGAPILVAEGAGFINANITTNLAIDFGVDNDRRVFEVNQKNTVWENMEFDLSQTITGLLNGLGTIARFAENASGFRMSNITIRNMFSQAYVYAFAINVGNRDWKIEKFVAEDLDVLPSGVEGDLNGSLRAIYVGYAKVGVYDNQVQGQGVVKDVSLKNLLQFEDTDGIQIIGTTGHLTGDFTFENISGVNVGKRIIKLQHRGSRATNIYADATAISNGPVDYMFSVATALDDDTHLTDIRGRGKFKAGVSTARSVTVENVSIVSTASGSFSGVHTGILHDFGGSPVFRNIRLSGDWRNHIFGGLSGFASEPIFEFSVDDFSASTPAEEESIRIDSSGNGVNFMTLCSLTNIHKSQTAASDRNAITIQNEGSAVLNINLVRLSSINAITNGYFTAIAVGGAEVCRAKDMDMAGVTSSGFEPVGLLSGTFHQLNVVGENYIANISSCTNTFLTDSTTQRTSGGAVRYNNSSNNAIVGLMLKATVIPVVNAGTASNNFTDAIVNLV